MTVFRIMEGAPVEEKLECLFDVPPGEGDAEMLRRSADDNIEMII